jgi:uncharacterized membrane protein
VKRSLLLVCHTIELVALAIWIGGLVVIIGAVIPAAFNSFGMEPAGRFLTRVFDGYNRLVVGAVILLTLASGCRFWLSADGLADAAVRRSELFVFSLMIGIAAMIIIVLGPSSVTLQEQAFAANDEAARRTAYGAFFKSHTVIRGLYLANLGLGIALLTIKLKDWMKGTRTP